MFTDTHLKELLSYKSSSPLISFYLNIDPSEISQEAAIIEAKTALKEEVYDEEREQILTHLIQEIEWAGKSIAVFSSKQNEYLRSFTFNVPISTRIRMSNRPHLKPIIDILDAFGGYGIVLVDKQKARFFNFHLGDLTEVDPYVGNQFKKSKSGGSSHSTGRRGGVNVTTNYSGEVVERNMREASEIATSFFSENNVRRVLIGGTEENTSMLIAQLPKFWQSLIVGTFPLEMYASGKDVYEKVVEIGRNIDVSNEDKMVNTLITTALKQHNATLGINETLSAVLDGKVQNLIYINGLRISGSKCTSCGHLSDTNQHKCAFCDQPNIEVPDIVDLAVRRVIRDGGDVEIIHTNKDLIEYGSIGAILRY